MVEANGEAFGGEDPGEMDSLDSLEFCLRYLSRRCCCFWKRRCRRCWEFILFTLKILLHTPSTVACLIRHHQAFARGYRLCSSLAILRWQDCCSYFCNSGRFALMVQNSSRRRLQVSKIWLSTQATSISKLRDACYRAMLAFRKKN